MNFWVHFILSAAAGILRAAVKNPKSFSGVEHYVVDIRDDTCELALAIDPNVPAPPGYKPA